MSEEMQDPERAAFELFASHYPHEAYEADPEKFWAYFHEKLPRVPREVMERMLKEGVPG